MRCLGILGLTFLALLPVRGTADAPSLAIGDLGTMRAASIAKLRARPDCLAWYDFTEPVPEGFQFIPGPGKGTLTPGDGCLPGQKALRIYHGRLLRKEIHIPDSGFTMCCWVRVNGLEKVDRHGHTRIAGGIMAVGSGYYDGWRFLISPVRSSVTFELGRPEIGARSLSSTGQLTSDEWHHVAVTWDHETMAMWIDGTLRAESVVTMAYNGAPDAKWLRIGECDSGLGVLDFDIADVGFFSSVLPAETLTDLGDPERKFREGLTRFLARIKPNAEGPAAEDTYRKQFAPLLALTEPKDSAALQAALSTARLRIAESLQREGLIDKARSAYLALATVDSAQLHHRARAMLAMGDLHRDQQHYAKARKEYQKTHDFFVATHEAFRVEALERLREIETMADGVPFQGLRQRRIDHISHPAERLFVSPNGADTNAGTEKKPFRTLERARDAVRQRKQAGPPPKGGIAIILNGGIYPRETASFELTTEDSGTPETPVIYQAAPGGVPILRAGRAVTGFVPLQDSPATKRVPAAVRKHVLQLNLRDAGVTDFGSLKPRGLAIGQKHDPEVPAHLELFHGGKPMSLARWPNDTPKMSERYTMVDVGDQETTASHGRKVAAKSDIFFYSDPRQDAWANEPDGWLFGCWQYLFFASYNRIHSIDPATRKIQMDWHRKTPYELQRREFAHGAPYQGINLLCELDSPGEWYLDRDSGVLYFWPPGNIDAGEAVVSMLEVPVITMDDVSHVVFRGLTIEAGRQHGVVIKGGDGILFAGSTIRNMGVRGITVEGGRNHEIVGCDLAHLGDAGIRLKGGDTEDLTPSGHLVENCHIHHFARWNRVGYQPAVGIRGVGNRISHCLVHDAPHQAFCVSNNDNILEYSEIHDVCHEAGDAGAYYMYGRNVQEALLERGQVVRYCYWHDLPHNESFRHVANATRRGIYIDSFNSNITVYGNIFQRFHGRSGAVFFGVCDNRVENSIFHQCRAGIYLTDRTYLYNKVNKAPSYVIDAKLAEYAAKPAWQHRYPRLGTFPEKAPDTSVFLVGNVVARNIASECEVFVTGSDRTIGFARIEQNWTEKDPGFQAPETGDFRLPDNALALAATDFEPLPLEKIGLYQDELRATWPVTHKSGNYETILVEPGDGIKRMPTPSMPVCHSKARTAPIVIDGQLAPEEWGELDRARATILSRSPANSATLARPSFMWMRHDADNLYIALQHELDPDQTPRPKPPGSISWWQNVDMAEIILEGPYGKNAQDWWPKDKKHGPLFYLVGDCAGQFGSYSIADLPKSRAEGLRGAVQYAAKAQPGSWTGEWKIPLAAICLDPAKTTSCCFNVGVFKPGTTPPPGSKEPVSANDQWAVWRGAGGANWKVWNVGLLHLGKKE